jgi:hypothetical protein
VREFREAVGWLLDRWRASEWHEIFLFAVLYIFGLLIPIIRQLTDIPIDWCLVFILSVLYFAVCVISLFTEKFGNENRGMYILLIGAFIAFIFSVSSSSGCAGDVINLMTIAVRLEILLLAMGVPLVFNTAIRNESPERHLKAIRSLKRFVYLSLFVIVLLLFQLSIFDKDTIGSYIFVGLIPIKDISIISVSFFIFIYSLFYFIYIVIKLIEIFIGYTKPLEKQKLKDSIKKDEEESIKEHCNNLDGKDIANIMREMIEKEIDKADDTLLGGMYHLLKLNCAYLKEHPETSISINLLWDKVEDMDCKYAGKIKSLLSKEFPDSTIKRDKTKVR